MADFTPLSTNFQDDVLASSNSKRKYRMINNSDGTVSFEDATVYSQKGSEFGAKEVNEEREAINQLNTDMDDIFGGREAEIRYINNVQADNTGYKQVTLTFNKKFTSNPYIFVTVVAPTKATAQVIVESISTKSCTFRVYAETSVSVMLQIMVIGSIQ